MAGIESQLLFKQWLVIVWAFLHHLAAGYQGEGPISPIWRIFYPVLPAISLYLSVCMCICHFTILLPLCRLISIVLSVCHISICLPFYLLNEYLQKFQPLTFSSNRCGTTQELKWQTRWQVQFQGTLPFYTSLISSQLTKPSRSLTGTLKTGSTPKMLIHCCSTSPFNTDIPWTRIRKVHAP